MIAITKHDARAWSTPLVSRLSGYHWLVPRPLSRRIDERANDQTLAGRGRYEQACPIARTLDLLGHRWTFLIIRDLLIRPRRFGELVAGLPGLSNGALQDRLERLVDLKLVTRRRLRKRGSPVEYRLTRRALTLRPLLGEIAVWGARHMDDSGGFFRHEWVSWWMTFWFDPDDIDGVSLTFNLWIDDTPTHVVVRHGQIRCRPGSRAGVDGTIRMPASAFTDARNGPVLLSEHVGDEALARTLRHIFPFFDEALRSTHEPDLSSRSYGQRCPLAAALDVLGEPWTLLIVRDLAIRPHGFQELLTAEPGLHPQLLSKRLDALADAELVEKDEDEQRYRLIPRSGPGLARVFYALGYWASWMLRLPFEGGVNPEWILHWMDNTFDAKAARGVEFRAQFYLGGRSFHCIVEHQKLSAGLGVIDNASVTVTAPPLVFMNAIFSEPYTVYAFATGLATPSGDTSDIRLMRRVFRFPQRPNPKASRIFS